MMAYTRRNIWQILMTVLIIILSSANTSLSDIFDRVRQKIQDKNSINTDISANTSQQDSVAALSSQSKQHSLNKISLFFSSCPYSIEVAKEVRQWQDQNQVTEAVYYILERDPLKIINIKERILGKKIYGVKNESAKEAALDGSQEMDFQIPTSEITEYQIAKSPTIIADLGGNTYKFTGSLKGLLTNAKTVNRIKGLINLGSDGFPCPIAPELLKDRKRIIDKKALERHNNTKLDIDKVLSDIQKQGSNTDLPDTVKSELYELKFPVNYASGDIIIFKKNHIIPLKKSGQEFLGYGMCVDCSANDLQVATRLLNIYAQPSNTALLKKLKISSLPACIKVSGENTEVNVGCNLAK